MPLVTRIIGDCPSCGAKNCFGNVTVGGDAVKRGCMNCSYGYDWPLTPVHKKVLYLDQFFFSRAFRMKAPAQDGKYADAVARIKELALKQVLVVPYGSVHEDETHQWPGEDGKTRDDLMEFIKTTSGGHKLKRAVRVQQTQVLRAFGHFLRHGTVDFSVEASDALPHDLHRWTNYIWIDVPGYYGDIDGIRADKAQTALNVAGVLSEWQASQNDFDANVALELRDGAQVYIDAFHKKVAASGAQDFEMALRVPYDASLVEAMFEFFPDEVTDQDRSRAILAFFGSPHFASVPYWWIWSHTLALLKERIKARVYAHPKKGPPRIAGFFGDIKFIGSYAPYCDAIFIDKAMEELMRDPRIGLSSRFGVKVFSEANWDAFIAWLAELDQNLSSEHLHDLEMAYPKSVADPIAVMRERMASSR